MIKTDVIWIRCHISLVGSSAIIVKNRSLCQQLLKVKKLVLVSATSLLVTETNKKDDLALEWVLYIYYSFYF